MVRYEAKMQIHGSMSRTSEGGNWIVKRVCVCVYYFFKWFWWRFQRKGMQGCCMNLEKSNKNCHKRPLKHLCTKGKNETERVKGELEGQRLAKKTDKKKVKNKKKWTKPTEPISPSNKHLSWTSFSDRQQWKRGGKKIRIHRELIKKRQKSEAARLIPER